MTVRGFSRPRVRGLAFISANASTTANDPRFCGESFLFRRYLAVTRSPQDRRLMPRPASIRLDRHISHDFLCFFYRESPRMLLEVAAAEGYQKVC
jgi:hypothetical protein